MKDKLKSKFTAYASVLLFKPQFYTINKAIENLIIN